MTTSRISFIWRLCAGGAVLLTGYLFVHVLALTVSDVRNHQASIAVGKGITSNLQTPMGLS